MRLDIRRIGGIKKGDEVIGNETRVKVVKNKVAPPFKQAEFDILYGEGISRIGEVIDIGTELNVIDKSGAWYSYNGQKLGQGKEKVREYLQENKELCAEIEQKIREMKGVHIKSLSSVSSDDGEERVSDVEELGPEADIDMNADVDL